MPEPLPSHRLAADGAALEAARYALLRRLAPALRHEAVAHLQPLAMVGSVLEKRLAAPEPDMAQVSDGVRRLISSSRGAVESCLDVIAWLMPEPGRLVPIHEAVAEAVQLLRGSLGFRGFTVRNTVGELDTPVTRGALRYVLPASLLWLTDSAGPPAEVTISAQAGPGPVHLHLDLAPTDGAAGVDGELPWRALCREEVEALAQAEGLDWAHEGDSITLVLPPAQAPAGRLTPA